MSYKRPHITPVANSGESSSFSQESKGSGTSIVSQLAMPFDGDYERSNCSVFNTKETFLHFEDLKKGNKSQRKAFYLGFYRLRNLIFADKLESIINEPEFDQNTRKAMERLRWCTSRLIVSRDHDLTGEVVVGSNSCKSPHCAICSKQRSAKLGKRFMNWLTDPRGQEVTKGKYWYFLTFTLKHKRADGTRQEIYLKELKKHMAKFVRQKDFKKYFGKEGKTWNGGFINSYEMTMGADGYHIHCHMLVCGKQLKERFKNYQKKLQENWLKLTGDSWNIRFDSIKPEMGLDGHVNLESGIQAKVIELFKYSVKMDRLKELKKGNIIRYAKWITETKGKNFINANGIFRGEQLTARKSKWDDKAGELVLYADIEYFFTKSVNLRFNHTLDKNYDKVQRKKIFQDINMDSIAGKEVIDVSDQVEASMDYISMTHDDGKGSIYGNKNRFEDNVSWFEMNAAMPLPVSPNSKTKWIWSPEKHPSSDEDFSFENEIQKFRTKVPDSIDTEDSSSDFVLVPGEKDVWMSKFRRQAMLNIMEDTKETIQYDDSKKKAWDSKNF